MDALTVLPFEPDWTEPVRERLAWLTDIQASAEEAAEQRIALRGLERAELRYRALALQPREAAALRSWLYGAAGKLLAVPFWPDAVRVTAAAAPGATALFVAPDASDGSRRIAPGARALLWRDPHTWELVEVVNAQPTSPGNAVVTVAPLVTTWPAGSYLVPAVATRLAEPSSRPLTRSIEEADELRFLAETEELIGTRIQATAGNATSTLKYGLPLHVPSLDGVQYELTVRVTNLGLANIVADLNGLTFIEGDGVIGPGETRFFRRVEQGDGATTLRLNLHAATSAGTIDCVAYGPSVLRLDTAAELVADAELDFAGGGWAPFDGSVVALTQNYRTGLIR